MIPPDGVDGMPARSTVFLPRTYDPRCHDLPASDHGRAMSIPAFSTWTPSTDKRKSAAYRDGTPGMTKPFSETYAESSHKFRRTPLPSRHQGNAWRCHPLHLVPAPIGREPIRTFSAVG